MSRGKHRVLTDKGLRVCHLPCKQVVVSTRARRYETTVGSTTTRAGSMTMIDTEDRGQVLSGVMQRLGEATGEAGSWSTSGQFSGRVRRGFHPGRPQKGPGDP